MIIIIIIIIIIINIIKMNMIIIMITIMITIVVILNRNLTIEINQALMIKDRLLTIHIFIFGDAFRVQLYTCDALRDLVPNA